MFRVHDNSKAKATITQPSVLESLLSGATEKNSIFVHDGNKWTMKKIDSFFPVNPPSQCSFKDHLNRLQQTYGNAPINSLQGEKVIGIQGERGYIGHTGPLGPLGIGIQGHTGPLGPLGIGIQGDRGYMGHTGPLGPLGIGIQGHTGPIGIGIQGHTGHTGPQGLIGPQGLTGKGERGYIGEQGEAGELGPRGPSGFGHTGPQGPQGIDGLQGHTGPQGPINTQGPISNSEHFFIDEISGLISIGKDSGKKGQTSVYIGPNSGHKENSLENTYVGYNTGIMLSGGLNTSMGFESGKYSFGTQNTYVGNSVCASTGSNGSYNTYVGSEAGYHNTSGSGNIFLGAVSGSSNTEGSWNIFAGQNAGQSNIDGTNNIFLGTSSGITNISGNNCICIGDSADVSDENSSNQIVIGNNVISGGDYTITFPNNLRSYPNGTEVAFSSPKGGLLYPVSSSIRWKENVLDIDENLDTSKIYKLRPVTFTPSQFISDNNDIDILNIGLIAEEVNEIYPILVPKDDMGRPSSVRYSLLGVLILAEMKKLRQELDLLKNK